MRSLDDRDGFTLIELMLVVAIIGLLAAIAIPKFGNLLLKAQEAALKGQLGALRSALRIYYSDNEGSYTASGQLGVLTIGAKYLDEFPAIQVPGSGHPRRFAIQYPPVIGGGGGGGGGMLTLAWTDTGDFAYSPIGTHYGAVSEIFIGCSHPTLSGASWSGQ